jgi:hypothetical protein
MPTGQQRGTAPVAQTFLRSGNNVPMLSKLYYPHIHTWSVEVLKEMKENISFNYPLSVDPGVQYQISLIMYDALA